MNCFRFFSLAAIAVLLSWLLVACSQQPVVELPPNLLSYSDPNAQPARKVLLSQPALPLSKDLRTAIASIGATLERVLPDNPLRFRYTVLNSLSVNAVGFGDGEVMLTSGALAVFDEPDMLAALFAHQMGHLVAGHRVSAAKYELPHSAYWKSLAGSERRLVTSMANLSFSLEQELEADQIAIELLRRGAYDERLYAAFLNRQQAIERDNVVLMGHSHPGAEARRQALAVTGDKALYTSQHDVKQFRQLLDGATVYRYYGSTHLNSEGVGYSDSGLVIRFGPAGEWLQLNRDTGRIQLGPREIRFRQFRGEDREEKMREAFRSYNIDAGGMLSRLERFRAKSWVTEGSCLLLENLALKPALLVFSETVPGNCDGVSHRGFGAITAEQQPGDVIARNFTVRLGYRSNSSASTNPVLAQYLFGAKATPIDEILNPDSRVIPVTKILY